MGSHRNLLWLIQLSRSVLRHQKYAQVGNSRRSSVWMLRKPSTGAPSIGAQTSTSSRCEVVTRMHCKVVAFVDRANQKAHSLIPPKHLQLASAGHMQLAEYFDDGTGYWGSIDPPACWWIETARVFLAALALVFVFIPGLGVPIAVAVGQLPSSLRSSTGRSAVRLRIS
jgi:hypothetical protein